MAIQVSGTEVISNARALTNIASVDATTVASMAAAGVGGASGEQEFVATGTLSAGTVVGIRSDGTIGTILPLNGSKGSFASDAFWQLASCALSTNTILVYWMSNNTGYINVQVGTVSGTSISFGSKLVIFGNVYGDNSAAVYCPNINKAVLAWNYGNATGRAVVLTISGTSVSAGSQFVFNTGYTFGTSLAYDNTNSKLFISWASSGGANGNIKAGTISGTTISMGSAAQFESGSLNSTSMAWDANAGKGVVLWHNNSTSYSRVFTVSGTSISYGSVANLDTNNGGGVINGTGGSIYDPISQKIVAVYLTNSGARAYVGTISGTSISWGSGVYFSSSNQPTRVATDGSGNIVVCWSTSVPANLTYYKTFVDGTVLALSSATELPSGTATNTNDMCPVFLTGSDKFVFTWANNGNAGTAIVVDVVNGGLSGYVGVTAASIANGATGKVTVVGGINTNQSGLLVGVPYGVDLNTGALSIGVNVIGRAISSTSLYLNVTTV